MNSFLKKVALIFTAGCTVLLVGLPAFSQGNTGRILGNITDATGALIPGASSNHTVGRSPQADHRIGERQPFSLSNSRSRHGERLRAHPLQPLIKNRKATGRLKACRL